MQLIITIISRTLAKCFLFIALSIGTPTVNAMRSLEDRDAIVIMIDNDRQRRERGLIRAFGYRPEYHFSLYV
jgi:hypothetical protein